MKILHICPLYHPSIGGNQTHMQQLAEKLAAIGEDVTVMTSRTRDVDEFISPQPGSPDLPAREMINGVKVERFAVNYRLGAWLTGHAGRGGCCAARMLCGEDGAEYFWHGPVTLGMLPAVRRLKPDLIMATNNYAFTFYLSVWARKLFNIPLVLMPITHFGDPWTSNPVLARIYAEADLLLACTEFDRRHLIGLDLAPTGVVTAPLGIPLNEAGSSGGPDIRRKYGLGDDPVVAYIGRMVANKGVDTLLDAMPEIWRRHPRARLLLAGGAPPDFARLIQEKIAGFPREQRARVVQTGRFPDGEKSGLFAAADIAVMASRIDAFGIIYLDAWAQSKPVIACRGTPQETIVDDEETGLLVDYGRPDQLAAAVVSLLDDRPRREKFGAAGLEKLKSRYNIDVYGRQIQKVYRELLDRKKGKS